MSWTVYLLRCADETLYCGIARDLEARLAAHARGKGARYTRGRGPLVLLASRRCREMGAALRIEHAVKQLSRAAKLALAADPRRLAAFARTVQRRPPRARKSRLEHLTVSVPCRDVYPIQRRMSRTSSATPSRRRAPGSSPSRTKP